MALRAFLPALAALLLFPALAGADGGAVVLRGESADWVLTVLAAPEPLRAGRADLSVLVQARETGEAVLDAEVTLTLEPPGGERLEVFLTRGQATNKLLHSVVVDLPVAGDWAVLVTVRRGDRTASITGRLPVGPPASRLATLRLPLAVPPIAVVLFACHQALVHRRRQAVRPRDPEGS